MTTVTTRQTSAAGATNKNGPLTNSELDLNFVNLNLNKLEDTPLDLPSIKPTLLLDFVNSKTLDPRITFTRNSIATYFDNLGILRTASAGQPRFNHDPSTRSSLGLLVEEQRTNSIRNSTMVGAAAGSPGTLPTNWTITGQGTLTRTIVGTGTEDGIQYLDVRFNGTTSTSEIYIGFEPATFLSATIGQTWTSSFYVKVVAGSLSNILSGENYIVCVDSVGTTLTEASLSAFAYPTTGSLATNRFTHTRTLTNANTVYIHSRIDLNFANGQPIDITLRIGMPQLEQGAFATSVIPTSAGAVTRNADVAVMAGTNFSSWYNQSEGTWYSEVIFGNGIGSVAQAAYSVSDGSEVNRLVSYRISTAAYVFDENPGGGSIAVSASANNTRYLAAAAYKINDMALSINGAAATTDTSVTISTKSQINIGDRATGSRSLNGHIRKLAFYRTRLTNQELQALTT